MTADEYVDRMNFNYDEGFKAGAEAMREAAAKVCVARVVENRYDQEGHPLFYEKDACAIAIRALPLPEPPK